MTREEVIANVLAQGQMNDMPAWKLYSGKATTSTPWGVSSEDSASWGAAAGPQLKAVLDRLPAGDYTVQFKRSKTENQPAEMRNWFFSLPAAYGQQAAIGNAMQGPGIGYVGKDYHESEMRRERDKHEHEKRMWEMDAKLEKLKEKKSAFEKLLENEALVNQLVPAAIGFFQSIMNPGATGQLRMAGLNAPPIPPRQDAQPTTEPGEDQPTELQLKSQFVMDTLIATEGSEDAAVELLYGMALYLTNPANETMVPILKAQISNTLQQHYAAAAQKS